MVLFGCALHCAVLFQVDFLPLMLIERMAQKERGINKRRKLMDAIAEDGNLSSGLLPHKTGRSIMAKSMDTKKDDKKKPAKTLKEKKAEKKAKKDLKGK